MLPIIVIYLFEYSTFRAYLLIARIQCLHACLLVQIQHIGCAMTERDRERTNMAIWRQKT